MRRRIRDLAALWCGTTLSYALLQAGVHLRRADALEALLSTARLIPVNVATAAAIALYEICNGVGGHLERTLTD